jgi:hypothetical protein
LTLSGNNGRLGNKSFIEKKEMNLDDKEQGYHFSRLWLNRELKEQIKWDRAEIEKRAEIISERFLKIWEIPDIQIEAETNTDEVNIFDAEDPTFKRLEYAIFFDNKIEENQVSKLYIEVFKQLFELQPETFHNTELGLKIGLTKDPTQSKTRSPSKINDSYYVEAGYSSKDKFDRIKQALTIFGLEDELSIKYAD